MTPNRFFHNFATIVLVLFSIILVLNETLDKKLEHLSRDFNIENKKVKRALTAMTISIAYLVIYIILALFEVATSPYITATFVIIFLVSLVCFVLSLKLNSFFKEERENKDSEIKIFLFLILFSFICSILFEKPFILIIGLISSSIIFMQFLWLLTHSRNT